MAVLSRRSFLRTSTIGTAALATMPITSALSRVLPKTSSKMVFRPYPHHWMPDLNYVYAADEFEDPFRSNITVERDGIVVPEDFDKRKFSVNTRWYVEGFGFLWLAADNGGEYYSLNDLNRKMVFNLNHEFARSRVIRNQHVQKRYEGQGIRFSSEVKHLVELSEELLEDAGKILSNGEQAAFLANKSLSYALWAGEKIELEKAKSDIDKTNRKDTVYFGCETRQIIWAKHDEFIKRFVDLFNFATVTHYIWDTWYEHFEPVEGNYNWGVKDDIVNWLTENNITIQGRPLFWFHPIVTPDWLKHKNFDELKKYVETHTHDLITHYGDKVLQWEIVNEYHDWANIHQHSHEQITEIVRLACDESKEVNPKVVRILNNCAPWAEYAAWGRYARQKEPADRPLRSPRKFIKDIIEAGVDFDVLGIQVYFPRRDLSDIVRMLERFEKFGKPIYITELGSTSGPTADLIATGKMNLPTEPYEWHRHWDEELQADWLEQLYTLLYSRPRIKAINWYDFADFRTHILNGGLIKEEGKPKRSFYRLKKLLESWGKLPGMKREM
jgi:endo-1,4-beta-xylanase